MASARTWRSLLFSPAHDWVMVGVAIALAGVAVLSAAGAWWWTDHAAAARARAAQNARLDALVQTLVNAIESELADPAADPAPGLSSIRRLTADAAVLHGLSACRLELPDGAIIADGDPRRITARELPAAWPAAKRTPLDPVTPESGMASVPARAVTVRIGERGGATLHVAAGTADGPGSPLASIAEQPLALGGALGIGLASAITSWWLMCVVRRRVRGLRVLHAAVCAAASGQDEPDALEIAEKAGVPAGPWNQLVRERFDLRQRDTLETLLARATTATPRDADLASACDAMWMGLVLVDETQTVRYLNGAASVFLGGKREELLGKSITDVLGEPAVAEALTSIMSGKSRAKLVVEVKRRGSSTGPKLADEQPERRGSGTWAGGVLRVSIRPIRKGDTGAAMLVIDDVTQQRVADESRNAFVAQATHELRTPLTNIRLYVEQLTDNEQQDPQARGKAINVISQEARRLERIVTDMLSVSEIEAGSLKLRAGDVRLTELLRQLQDDYKPQAAAKDIVLAFDLGPKLPVLTGDRDKIALAVHNLLGNAIKYTPAGGAVSLRADTTADGKSLCISVTDNGIGIKPEECDKVFEKFYRAQDRRITGITGSGLGLALAREVARMHGGDITLTSQIDKGSTFTLSLPAAPPPAAMAA
ncbi:MAG: ATP-binding protein [Phycisphaerales bacterium]